MSRSITKAIAGIREVMLPLGLLAIVLSGCGGGYDTDAALVTAAERAYDRQPLVLGLERIAQWHVENDTDVADGLRPGLQVEQIEAMLTDAGCEATDEMRDLWSWHNGSDASSPFIWYHDFLSLDEATSQFRLLRRMPLVSWPSDYLPAFSFDGEWYGLYCGGDGRDAGPVLHLLLEGEPRVTNVNLTALILQSAESMASGAITWQNGGMKEDISAVHQIHQQYNSGYPFPHYVEGSSGH